MNVQALGHSADSFYRYAETRNSLVFRLRTGRGDAAAVTLKFWPRANPEALSFLPMTVAWRDSRYDYYEVTVNLQDTARYIKYFFSINDTGNKTVYLCEYGCSEAPPEKGFFEHLYTNEGDIIREPAWARGIIYYQIFPDRFARSGKGNPRRSPVPWGSAPNREDYTGGNLEGIISRLDYLKDLGVECLYLTPIFLADYNHKYATIDYFQVDPDFGDEKGLQNLVRECHARGIRILLDGVFNHCGVHFAPFEDILAKQEASGCRDWFYIKQFPVEISASCYACVGDFPWMPKLNTSNPDVQEFIIKVMDYWIDTAGIDGWRLDVADEADLYLWRIARRRLKQKYPEILLLGETWGDASRLLDGSGLDSVMNYLFRDAVLDFIALRRIDAPGLDGRLNALLAKYRSSTNLLLYNLLDSHDTPRFLEECGGNTVLLKLAAAFQMLFPGSPAVYYGDEAGMRGKTDPHCRGCMIREDDQNQELLSWYRKLISLRKKRPVLRTGEFRANFCDQRVYGFVRWEDSSGPIYTILNGGEARNIALPVMEAGEYTELVGGNSYHTLPLKPGAACYNGDILRYAGILDLTIPEWGVMILEPRCGTSGTLW